MQGLTKYYWFLRTLTTNPWLAREYFKVHQRARRDVHYRNRTSEYADMVVSLEKGLESVLHVDRNAIFNQTDADTIAHTWEYVKLRLNEQPAGSPWAKGIADKGLLETYYRVCRVLQPDTVLETGVAFGSSTLFILTALDMNDRGALFSIDLPLLTSRSRQILGSLVPAERRAKWKLLLNSSGRILPRLVEELGSIDIFIHDSDHTYENMMFEFTTVWLHLHPGGILIADDVNQNNAFLDFAELVQRHPVVIKSLERSKLFGLIAK